MDRKDRGGHTRADGCHHSGLRVTGCRRRQTAKDHPPYLMADTSPAVPRRSMPGWEGTLRVPAMRDLRDRQIAGPLQPQRALRQPQTTTVHTRMQSVSKQTRCPTCEGGCDDGGDCAHGGGCDSCRRPSETRSEAGTQRRRHGARRGPRRPPSRSSASRRQRRGE